MKSVIFPVNYDVHLPLQMVILARYDPPLWNYAADTLTVMIQFDIVRTALMNGEWDEIGET